MKKHKTNKAKRVSSSCENNGSCPHCTGNRTFQSKKEEQRIESFYEDDPDKEEND